MQLDDVIRAFRKHTPETPMDTGVAAEMGWELWPVTPADAIWIAVSLLGVRLLIASGLIASP